jgi:lysylphosphatidylglycerol synthetase-like protein (DUF2156 family)
MTTNTSSTNDASAWKTALQVIVTLAVLVGFVALVLYLLRNLTMNEQQWLRSTWIFSGVEAIVFAAVGWLFGREVHREQAEKAEARADAATEMANKGEVLARMVLAQDNKLTKGATPGQMDPAITDLAKEMLEST